MAHKRSVWKYWLLLLTCTILDMFLQDAVSSKILIFNSMGEGSHYFVASSLAEELYHRGHSISVLISSQFEDRCKQPPHGDMFDFHIVHTNASIRESFEIATTEAFNGKIVFRDSNFLMALGKNYRRECQAVLNTTVLEKLRQASFNLLVCDPFWPCSYFLGDYLGIEKVAVLLTSLVPTLVFSLGGISNPAIFSQCGLGYPRHMTFCQRLNNFFAFHFYLYFQMKGSLQPYIKLFQERNITVDIESLAKINLYFVSSDPIFDQKIPTMPGHVQTAGLTIRKPRRLAKDLEKFVSSSGEDGIIIFSIGSYIPDMPTYFVKEFQEAFSRLPQKVIWQWKREAAPKNMPENVKTMSWIPQMDLLGHKQTKLLIYQGGNNGIYEAINSAVPVLVMPLVADQFDVAQRVVESGIGLRIRVSEVTSERIVECITTILKDPKYRENVERLSAIFRDRPQTPRERAAFMIEHVLKFGSDHLRSPSHDLNFIQLHLIDVYLFLILCFIFVLLIFYFVFRLIFNLFCHCTFRNKVKRD